MKKKEIAISKFAFPITSSELSLPLIGGKGLRLAELARANFPVPPCFIITTDAYKDFVETNKLDRQISELNNTVNKDKSVDLETISQTIRDLFESNPIPGNIDQDIIKNYQDLNSPPVAVRSSATSEDLSDFSFAGLHDTYLNVKGETAVLVAVKRCWSSLWTARAIAYRRHHRIDTASTSQAVLVQHMVLASASGILLTVNPATGNKDETIVNAAWGLGESVVRGRITPDTIVVEKATSRIKHLDIGNKKVMTVPATQGTIEIQVKAQERQKRVLSEEQVRGLTHLGNSIESHFNAPQDIEWVIDANKIHVVQSRPITGSREEKDQRDQIVPGNDDWPGPGGWSANPFDRWTRSNVGEVWPNPVSPLVASTVPKIISEGIHHSFRGVNVRFLNQIQWARRFYGRVYYNEGALRYIISNKLGLPDSIMDRTRGSGYGSKVIRKHKFNPIKIIIHLPILARITFRQLRTGKKLEAYISKINQWVAEFLDRNNHEFSDRKLWAEAEEWLDRIIQALNLQNDMSGYSQTTLAMLERLTVNRFDRQELALDLISGLPGIQANEIGTCLEEIAQKIIELGLSKMVLDNSPSDALDQLRKSPKAKPVIRILDSFLENHGYRCPNEAEWLHPRWADTPEQVIDLAASYLKSSKLHDFSFTEARQKRIATIAWTETKLGLVRRAVFRIVLRRAEHAIRLRENGKSHAIKASYPARQIAVLLGQRWMDRGWLGKPEDFFFLTFSEIQKVINANDPSSEGLNLKKLVAGRCKAYEYWFTVDAPENLGPDGKPCMKPTEDLPVKNRLQGIPASSGRVRGTARVIHNPTDATKMNRDEILVTRAIDTGWTAVFPLIAGLVTEIGGQLSHYAIQAREYGLPSVVNVSDATALIHDGQTISIDGKTGYIYLENEEAD